MAAWTFDGTLTVRRLVMATALVVAVVLPALLGAEETPDKPRANPRGRLPAYYAKVVTAQQKEQVYSIQAQFEPKINALEAQIAALERERDEAIRGLLTPEQRKQIDELAAAAAARRNQRKQSAEVDEQAASSEQSPPAKTAKRGAAKQP